MLCGCRISSVSFQKLNCQSASNKLCVPCNGSGVGVDGRRNVCLRARSASSERELPPDGAVAVAGRGGGTEEELMMVRGYTHA